ncbi:MAG TPA: helix-turn-helix transcriptional regulator [Dehalococcoidia bacterium]|nr:helix-turn-helix transcriptional regulator [Dehalococcoidia bacterium]
MTLGKTIRGAREELGMSQAQLASCGGLSQGYLSQLENDEVRNPSAAVIFRLARGLHLDPRTLMQAAGYTAAEEENGEGFEVSVDPDLLRFLARMPRGQQEHLLRLLKGMEPKTAVGTTGGRR